MTIRIVDYPKCQKIQFQAPDKRITQYYGKDKMLQISEKILENGKKEVTNATVDLLTNRVLQFIKEVLG